MRSPSAKPPAPTVWLLGLSVLATGFLSLALGQDGNWDLRNYHWYNAWAFATGRLGMDIAPAQVATFYNPTLDLPFFWLAEALPARAVGFLLGVVQGANMVALFAIAWALLDGLPQRQRGWAALGVAILCFAGGGQVGLIGTTFYDNVISLFVLGGAWVVVANRQAVFAGTDLRRAFALVAVAGLLVGGGVGLKQPTLPYAVGFCFAFLLVSGGFWRRMFLSFFFGIGVIAGMAAFSGHWMWYLWDTYGNPLFPYFNDIFHSPWAVDEPYRDDKFVPATLAEALAFPFLWVLDPKQVGEIAFRDLRVTIAYVVVLATPLAWLAGRLSGREAAGPAPAGRYILVAGIITYLVWLKLFGIYRYLIPLEMLAPLVTLAALAAWPLGGRARAGLGIVLLLLMAVTTSPGNWGRIAWTDRFVEVQAPALPDPDNTILLQSGFAPTSFLAYGFPAQVPVLRLHSYFNHPDQADTLLTREIHRRLAAHDGDMFLILAHWEVWTTEHVLPAYGLAADVGACRPITSNLDEPMMLCPVRKTTGPAQAG